MKNIEIIYPQDIPNFISSLWLSDEFKQLHHNNLFFKILVKKLSRSPIFFYDLSHPKGRNHLTSIFRFIAKRQYDNPYIQDLYYFHELCHCAQYSVQNDIDYELWSKNLSINELYASLFSEVFIYFFSPEIMSKTFDPLWARRFVEPILNDKDFIQNSYGFFYNQTIPEDLQWNNNIQSVDLFSIDLKSWPKNIQNIFIKRQQLRSLKTTEQLDDAEKIIVNYNIAHQKWIGMWKTHYKKIDTSLLLLQNQSWSAQKFLEYVVDNCDDFGRPFFPR